MTFGFAYTDHLPADFADRSLREDVLTGLTAARKWLPPKWFYDKVGSELFEDITRLPEYYPTRTERAILTAHAGRIVELAGTRTLIELGSGSSDKTRLLLDAMQTAADGDPDGLGYVALDVSEDALRQACAGLVAQYPRLRVAAVRADFTHQLDVLPPGAGRTVAFLGSTIGNLDPAERAAFLAALRAGLRPGDDPADFDHQAVWDATAEWIEMRLRARRPVAVRVDDLDLDVRFDAGEDIRTEISTKFRRDRLTVELTDAGFTPQGWWTDEQGWFSLSLWGVR
jgi:L-histidine N-alpha-methyltransferase